jgi:hypothetical protein
LNPEKTMKLTTILLPLMMCSAAVTHGATVVYTAVLSGAAESPVNDSLGTGNATVTIDTTLNTMRVEVFFSGLTGTVTNAHIHAATTLPLAGTAGVATMLPTFTGFPSGVTSGTYDNSFDMTLASSFNPSYVTAHGGTAASAFADLQTAMAGQQSYLNIHSSAFAGGEIRGFLVPETSSALLLSLGAGGALFARRRRA